MSSHDKIINKDVHAHTCTLYMYMCIHFIMGKIFVKSDLITIAHVLYMYTPMIPKSHSYMHMHVYDDEKEFKHRSVILHVIQFLNV